MQTLHAHFLHTPEPEHLDYLKSHLQDNITVTTGEDVPENVTILITGRPNREHLTDRPHLSALLIPFAGIPASTSDLMRDFPHISIHNLHHNAPMTAEMALTLMLAAAKHIVPIDRVFRQNDWRPRYENNPTVVLDGKTMLILGYGAVGRHVGKVAQALSMTVLATKRSTSGETPNGVELHPPDALHNLLPRAHVLMISLPGTPETEGLIGAGELARLPKGAILVNVGRGSVVDQKALYEALRDGHLHAAGLDVWYNYPPDAEARPNTPPSDYPLNELDNVVMSPHRAGGGGAHEVELRRMHAIAESLNAAARGESIPHRMNLDAGY